MFKDKTVCILGYSYSGHDIVREISLVSKKTYYVGKSHGV